MAHAPIRISKARFEAFSDGVFAIAITLLVLELRPPDLAAHSNASLAHALLALWPQYLVYAASFATIGIMWFNHYALFHEVRYITYATLIANLALLMLIAFLPFPTLLLGRYGLVTPPTFFYSATFVAISICFTALRYVTSLKPGERASIGHLLDILGAWTIGPIAYGVATVVSIVSPLASIIIVAALAVYYMLPWSIRSALAGGAAQADAE